MNTIPEEEIAELFRKAIRGETKVVAVGFSWNSAGCGNARVRIDGYDLVIFNDCQELDYVDSVTAPDGRTGDFDDWLNGPVAFLNPDEQELMERILESAEVVDEADKEIPSV